MSRLITGLSRERERSVQQSLFVRQSRRFNDTIAREIYRGMTGIASQWNNPGKQAWEAQKHRNNIQRILEAEWRAAFDTFGKRVLDAILKSYSHVQKKDVDEYEKRIEQWIATNTAHKVTQIAGTTYDQAIDIISPIIQQATIDGLAQAETGKLIQSAIREQGGVMARARSRVIARTETHAASQAGVQMAAESSGFPAKKEWIAARGDRTRPDHEEADGQVVGLHEYFIVGGESLRYPGDPLGSAGQVINCRCVEGIIIE